MHPEAIRPSTKNCLALLSRQPWQRQFYLAGGTGLALHLGHRFSDDLDFFSEQEVDPKKIRSFLSPLGTLKVEMEREGTLWATLNETKISFFHYEYPLLDKLVDFEGTAIAGIKDIACMKLDTVSSRGSRKDFVDLFFILKESFQLQDLLAWFRKKYSQVSYNEAHLLKSLTYFEDAEGDVEPQTIKPADWNQIRRYFQTETKKVII